MSSDTPTVFSQAMKLAPQDRQQLAESLWDSLEIEKELSATSDIAFDSLTSERRAEILSGEVSTISHQELKQQLGR